MIIKTIGGFMIEEYIECFSCGAKSLNIEGESHKYMLASPGCWAMFYEVMEREYSDSRYWMGHQFTVDAYACQHIGMKDDKRAINSVNIHLAGLYGLFEEGLSFSEVSGLRNMFSQYYKNKDILSWLNPPASFSEFTIFELWNNENPDLHFEIAEKWARSVWQSWSHKHKTIAELIDKMRKS